MPAGCDGELGAFEVDGGRRVRQRRERFTEPARKPDCERKACGHHDNQRGGARAVGGELVARGEVELGFFNLSEIPKGVTVAGALPGPLQGYTVYEAAVLSKGSTAGAVTAFVKYLASAAVAAHWSGASWSPHCLNRCLTSGWALRDVSAGR